MSLFTRYIGIDYSGAGTATASLKGLRVYEATTSSEAVEVQPPTGTRKHWTRAGIAHWLVEKLTDTVPTCVGIDHGFSFPREYFEAHELPLSWDTFLADFHQHWPTNEPEVTVDSIRQGLTGQGTARSGRSTWRRLCEKRAGGAKSVFHFDVPGSVAKSTHTGLPWLHFLRLKFGSQLHAWPFDGWDIPVGKSMITEVYPSLWSHAFDRADRTPDQHDAYTVAEWLRQADQRGELPQLLHPTLTNKDKAQAAYEGWIFGVT